MILIYHGSVAGYAHIATETIQIPLKYNKGVGERCVQPIKGNISIKKDR